MAAKRIGGLIVAAAASLGAHAASEESLPAVIVERILNINPNIAVAPDSSRTRPTSADGGEFISQVNGVSFGRFGGRGLEPIVRGQSQTRINVLLDGAYIHGGCPNRMDPPASWAALETYDEVRVIKGVQTLLYGAGGSGGTVLFDRDTHSLAEDEGVHGRVSLTGTDNGTEHDLLADVVAAGERSYVRVLAETKRADDYTDGSGTVVRSSYDQSQGGIILGYLPGGDAALELSIEHSDFEDALYPGAGMDSPVEEADIFRLKYSDRPRSERIRRVDVEAYVSDVEHLMDNYSLRDAPLYPAGTPMAGKPMKRATPTTSKTTGARLILESGDDAQRIEYGIDLSQNERLAISNNMDSGTPVALAYLWPDATIRQTGFFAEATRVAGDGRRLKYGARIDRVDASADRADANLSMVSANTAYRTYYGTEAGDSDETNLGALLRYEVDLAEDTMLFAGLSRSVRTADATERFLAKWNTMPSMRWIGNPGLEPEKHHQIDIGVETGGDASSFSAVFFHDEVSDYILRDTARGQDGILRADGADIYRNVDARLWGLEIEAARDLTDRVAASMSFAYVRATNRTDGDRPIAQTPPLGGELTLEYTGERANLGARVRFADRQDRIDALSKQEVGETPGWGVVDVFGSRRISDALNLRFGVDNLFDKTYAQHASRANLFETDVVKVNEPGRTLWLRIEGIF